MAGDQPRRQRTEPTPTTGPTAAPGGGDLTEAEEERYKRARLRVIGLALEFGFTTITSFVVFLGGGIWLDRRFGTAPLCLLIGLVLAFFSVGYTLYQLASVKTGPRRARKATEGTSEPRRPAGDWDDEDERDADDDWPVRRRTDG